jgi:hypothetical protein
MDAKMNENRHTARALIEIRARGTRFMPENGDQPCRRKPQEQTDN